MGKLKVNILLLSRRVGAGWYAMYNHTTNYTKYP